MTAPAQAAVDLDAPAAADPDALILRALLWDVLTADAPLARMRRLLVREANASPFSIRLPDGRALPVHTTEQVYALVEALRLSPQDVALLAPDLAAGLVAVHQREMLLTEAVVQYSRSPRYRRHFTATEHLQALQAWLGMPGHAGAPEALSVRLRPSVFDGEPDADEPAGDLGGADGEEGRP